MTTAFPAVMSDADFADAMREAQRGVLATDQGASDEQLAELEAAVALAPVTAAADDGLQSAVIVALPTLMTNLPRGSNDDPEPLHATIYYLPDPDPDTVESMGDLLAHLAVTCEPFTASISGHGRLGDDDAAVVFLDSPDLQALHDLLAQAVPAGDQFPSYIPHTTLSYGDEIDLEAVAPELPDEIMFDRLALWNGNTRNEYVLCGTNDDEEDDVDLLDGMALVDDDVELVVASGVSIPPVDGPDDLDAAIAYATEHPAARWYVERRARSLQAGVTLPWEPTEPTLAEPEDDDDLELNGPGGVQAAAAWYVRTCSEGGEPGAEVYDDLIAAATAHDMLGDPVVASAIEWKTWVEQ